MAATLPGLPPEIFELIFEHLNCSDLLPFRLVCREIDSKTLRLFSDVYFTTRGILLSSSESLQTAIEIAKHEAFGPDCQELLLFVNAFDVPENTMTLGLGESFGPEFHMPGSFKNIVDWNQYEHHQPLLEDQKSLYRTYLFCGAQELLAELFQALDKHGKVETLTLADLAWCAPRPLVTRGFRDWDLLCSGAKIKQEIFNIIAVALVAHKSSSRLLPSLKHFSMRTEDKFHMPLKAVVKPRVFWPWYALLSQFESVDICPRLDRASYDAASEVGMQAFVEMAASTKIHTLYINLSEFTIGDEWEESFDTPIALFAETFVSLKTLELQGAVLLLEDLAEFIQRQPLIESVVLTTCLIWYTRDEHDTGRELLDVSRKLDRLVGKPQVRIDMESCDVELNEDED